MTHHQAAASPYAPPASGLTGRGTHRPSAQQLLGPNLLPCDGTAILVENLLSDTCADALNRTLMERITWEQHHVRIYGKTLPVPRLTAWFGAVPYAYSGLTHPPAAWPPELDNIRTAVSSFVGVGFNTVLANRYDTGSAKVGWHADDEGIFGTDPTIASLSLGATRRFSLRHRNRVTPPLDIDLKGGSLLIMAGATQRYWQHTIRPTRRPVGVRINLTFRVAQEDN